MGGRACTITWGGVGEGEGEGEEGRRTSGSIWRWRARRRSGRAWSRGGGGRARSRWWWRSCCTSRMGRWRGEGEGEGGQGGLERQRSFGNRWSSSPQRVADLKGESWEEGESFASGGVSRTLLERWVVHYERTKKGSWLGFGPVLAKQNVAGAGEMSGSGGAGAGTEEEREGAGLGRGGGGASSSGLPANHVLERPVVYKRTVIMLRSLYCLVRTLPAFRLFKLANYSSHSRSFSLSYTVSSAPSAMSEQDEGAMIKCNLTPIETQWGRLCISSVYRNATAVTALEVTPRILPRIIPDYVGSPTTDPLRRFTSVGSLPSAGLSGRHGVYVVPLPGSVPNSPSGAFGRRHSWSGGINKVQPQPPSLPISPSYKSSSPSPSHPSHDFQNSPPKTPHFFHHSSSPSGTHIPSNLSPRNSPLQRQFVPPPSYHHPHNDSQPIPIHTRRSPPFSPSPSPSPPQHGYNQQDSRLRSSSAPVTIPRPTNINRPLASARVPPDVDHRSRIPLPPPSPQTRPMELPRAISFNSRLHSGSGGHVSNLSLDSKIAGRSADSSGLVSPQSRFRGHQAYAEDQVDDLGLSGIKRSVYSPPGLVLGGFRAASKVSSHNHEDPEEVNLECPFAPDNDEAEDYRSRVGSPGVRLKVPDSPDFQGGTPGSAVGALVRILKGAAPLRQQSAPPAFADLPVPRMGSGPSSPVGIAGQYKNSPPKPNSLGAHNIMRGRPSDLRHAPSLEGNGRAEPPFAGGIGSPPSIGVRQASSKSAADALEELRQYREMRDFLVRQSGGNSGPSHQAVKRV
ncbi:hypothetical protein KC19_6G110900 [Ceratodon purpureus]|uniref:Autophagy-related protein 13 N-terminal domain-containing protein n=1 Tax=Ceratodon purpureus TaxID=3225 RepID=A0A8T0HGF3_CERPU|nr:hypothetical protein KC19_6G110900 [Ceratodon purpureus]